MASRFEMDHGDGEGGRVGITDPVAGGSVAVLTPHCVSVRPYLRTAYSLAWRVSIDATVLVQFRTRTTPGSQRGADAPEMGRPQQQYEYRRH